MEYDARKLSERLEQLNREQRVAMERLVEELLEATKESRSVPKRADEVKASSRAA